MGLMSGTRVTGPVRHVSGTLQRLVGRQRSASAVPAVPSAGAVPVPTVKGVRRRRPADLAATVRLVGLIGPEYPFPRPASHRDWLTADDVLDSWVVERNGEILGHVAVSRVGVDAKQSMRWRETTGRPTADLAAVSRFFVRPRARGEGLGTALLRTAVADIRARGLVPVAEMVSARRDGIAMYERNGWHLVAMYPVFDGRVRRESYMYSLPTRVRG
jgi:GNAT superfamily N-acetyltransferase